MKVLYAEDEAVLAGIIADGLVESGYEVLQARNGQEALDLFKREEPDICIFDIMMPLKDGYMLADDIRKLGSKTPIIFLSAKSLPEDIIKGFKSGGNDYLKKPFNMGELLVRIESLLKRFGSDASTDKKITVYHFGNCELDTVNQKLVTSSGEYRLSFKEVALLEMLLLHKNNILKRQESLLEIWGDDNYYNSKSMNVFMAHLRRMLKDEPGVEIVSLRGIGYKLICNDY
jgi:DNA-binding response OmpR family regulator